MFLSLTLPYTSLYPFFVQLSPLSDSLIFYLHLALPLSFNVFSLPLLLSISNFFTSSFFLPLSLNSFYFSFSTTPFIVSLAYLLYSPFIIFYHTLTLTTLLSHVSLLLSLRFLFVYLVLRSTADSFHSPLFHSSPVFPSIYRKSRADKTTISNTITL